MDRPGSEGPSRRLGLTVHGWARLAILANMAIWGSLYTVTKLLLREFPPFTLGALRFTSAGIILLAIGLPVYKPSLRPGQFPWGTFLLIGFFGVALYSGALNIGLRLTSAVDAALIQAFIPAAFALAAALVLGERLTAGRILGIGLSIVGMALVVGSAGFGGQHNLLGDLLVVLTVVGWVISAVLVKRVSTSVNQTLISGFATFCGALFLIPVSVVELAVVGLPSHVSWTAWGLLTYQALVGSVFAYWCQNTALRHLQASEVASYVNLNSVIGVGLAAIVLGESLLPLQIVGGVLVLGGVYLAATGGGVSRWWARQSPRATPPG